MKRASALILAIWIIAILSIIVVSFSVEARLQAGVNVYVRERARVNHLIDAGKVISELIVLGYKDVQGEQDDEDLDELLEKDRWLLEKRGLKEGRMTTKWLLIDEENPDSGVVKIDIKTEQDKINVNLLSEQGGDSNYQERWWMIFKLCGIPEELDTVKDGKIKLWNLLIASWNDWRDTDDSVSSIDMEECGAEAPWYKEMEEDEKIEAQYRNRPRNGPIPEASELRWVRGWRDYPEVLTGGVINPWEDKTQQLHVRGVLQFLDTEGGMKINVNNLETEDLKNILVTVPGIYDNVEDDEVVEKAGTLARAIIKARATQPNDYKGAKKDNYPFKDFNDLEWRLNNNDLGTDIDNEEFSFEKSIDRKAEEYLEFGPEDNTQFLITITGWSGGMERSVIASCYVKDDKIVYVDWRESPGKK